MNDLTPKVCERRVLIVGSLLTKGSANIALTLPSLGLGNRFFIRVDLVKNLAFTLGRRGEEEPSLPVRVPPLLS